MSRAWRIDELVAVTRKNPSFNLFKRVVVRVAGLLTTHGPRKGWKIECRFESTLTMACRLAAGKRGRAGGRRPDLHRDPNHRIIALEKASIGRMHWTQRRKACSCGRSKRSNGRICVYVYIVSGADQCHGFMPATTTTIEGRKENLRLYITDCKWAAH
jgi:hypothetical protein